VLRALEENAIPIDAIAGASAGALIGGAYAAGLRSRSSKRWRELPLASYGTALLLAAGAAVNAPMENFLRANLRLPVSKICVSLSPRGHRLQNGTAVVMSNTGDVTFAIRASVCLPAFYVLYATQKEDCWLMAAW